MLRLIMKSSKVSPEDILDRGSNDDDNTSNSTNSDNDTNEQKATDKRKLKRKKYRNSTEEESDDQAVTTATKRNKKDNTKDDSKDDTDIDELLKEDELQKDEPQRSSHTEEVEILGEQRTTAEGSRKQRPSTSRTQTESREEDLRENIKSMKNKRELGGKTHYQQGDNRTGRNPRIYDLPTMAGYTKIKEFIDKTYGYSTRQLFKDYGHPHMCRNQCSGPDNFATEQCRYYNEHQACYYKDSHSNKNRRVTFLHRCTNCAIVLHTDSPHKASCDCCPVNQIAEHMKRRRT